MRGSIKYFGSFLFICCVVFVPMTGFAQDLGSSSDLFKPSESPAKKSSSKKRSPGKRKRSNRKSTAKTKKPASKSQTASNTLDKSARKFSITKADTQANPTGIGTNKVIVYGGSNSARYSEQFEDAIFEGNNARNQRNYVAAEAAYKRAREIDRTDSRAIYGLGNIFSDQQRWEEAERAYRQAIILEPDSAAPYSAMSYVLAQPIVGLNLSERYREAERMSRTAIRIAPDNALAYDQLGVAMELNGHISENTQKAYRKAIELEPTFALAYAHLGRILLRNGVKKESAAVYRKSIQLASDVPTMIMIADVLQSQQNFTESERLLRTALSQDPRHPTALYLLGRSLTVKQEFAEAETVLMKSVKVSPNSFVSYALLGSMYSRQGHLSKAERALDEALKVISENEKKRLAQEFEEVGDGFMKKEGRRDAIRVYLKALSLDPENKSLTRKLSQTRLG